MTVPRTPPSPRPQLRQTHPTAFVFVHVHLLVGVHDQTKAACLSNETQSKPIGLKYRGSESGIYAVEKVGDLVIEAGVATEILNAE